MNLRYLFAFVFFSFASLMVWEIIRQDSSAEIVAEAPKYTDSDFLESERSPASATSINLCHAIKRELYKSHFELVFFDIQLNTRNRKLNNLPAFKQLRTCFEQSDSASYKIEIEAFSSNWLEKEDLPDLQLQISLFDSQTDKVAEFGLAYLIDPQLNLLPYLPEE